MIRLIFGLIGLTLVFTAVVSAQKEAPPAHPICGTDQAMEKIPHAARQDMIASSSVFRASELLLYLNFNGGMLRPGFGNAENLTSELVSRPTGCPAPFLTQAQKDEIVRLVSDDFSPFNIRVTTDATMFFAYPRNNKEMLIVTTSPQVIGQPFGVAGVSPFAGIGFRLPNNIAFAFSSVVGNNPSDVAAVISHESAHLLGLGHQHLYSDSCNFLTEYHPGFGSGPLSFAPLMGEGFSRGVNNWFAQSCTDPFFGVAQNDYELINSQVEIRADDFPDTPDGSTIAAERVNGVLERAGDVDFLRINFKGRGAATITSNNIDLKVTVLTPGRHVVEEFNDPESTGVTIPLVMGMRYLKVQAASNENMSSQFMTGTYRVTY